MVKFRIYRHYHQHLTNRKLQGRGKAGSGGQLTPKILSWGQKFHVNYAGVTYVKVSVLI